MQTRGGPAEMQKLGEHGERGQILGFQCHKLKLSQASKHFIGRIAQSKLSTNMTEERSIHHDVNGLS